jgi:EAL domain-containing protein (putative c-di-GMP-specific phosphodiesterase class I)
MRTHRYKHGYRLRATSPGAKALIQALSAGQPESTSDVTAEAVEDAQTLEFLNTIGCDLAQGYFIGRPMPGNVVVDWIAKRCSSPGCRSE